MTRSLITHLAILVVGLVLLLAVASCGGRGAASPTIANPTISITWPARTRGSDSIPAPGSAMSVHVSIEGATTGANAEVFITRDNNVGLHTGQYPIGQPWSHEPAHFTSIFYSEPNQGGSIVGTASGNIDASGNNFNLINISLVATVKSVKVIEPTTVSVSPTPTQLLFEADGDGNTVVPVSPGSAHWFLVSGSGSTLSPDGLLTTNQAGSLVVKVVVDGITSPNKTITVTDGPIDHVTFEDLTDADSTASVGNAAGGANLLAGSYRTAAFGLHDHAAFWTNGVRQDVHPQGKHSSVILGLAGTSGVGHFSPSGSTFHAAIFSGGGMVDLDPTGTFSDAVGTDGATQVGNKQRMACKWQGTPQSFVDLHPSQWRESYATGVSGTTISGWLSNVPTGGTKAVMWTGQNSDMVDLDPPGFQGSYAYAVSGGTVGGAFTQNDPQRSLHACLWHGTPQSVVDLNPSIAGGSTVLGVSGNVAVGWYVLPINDQIYRACIWNGTSSSFIDLNAVLGSSYTTGSQALSIAPEPGGYQVVGWAKSKNGETFGARVIVWHVPSSLLH